MFKNEGEFVLLSQQFYPRLSTIACGKETALALLLFKPGQQYLDSSVSVTQEIII